MSGLSGSSVCALAPRSGAFATKSFRSTALTFLALGALASGARAAQDGVLFPDAFRVEHHLIQEDGEGTRFLGEPVVDVYGGSWIVSQRPDGSRLIVDLARRELTEVRPDKGTYWTTSVDRLAELRDRLRAAEGLASPAAETSSEEQKTARRNDAVAAKEPELLVTEVPVASGSKSMAAPAGAAARPGVRHLRVSAPAKDDGMSVEVWVDPAFRLAPAAVAALDNLESQLLTPAQAASTAHAPGRFLAAARSFAAGALPVRTRRPLTIGRDGAALGAVEDVVTHVERLDRFPAELVEIPASLRRVPHPLEATVRFLEEDRERNRAMSGGGSR